MHDNPVIRRATLEDIDAVKHVMTHPDVYPFTMFDGKGAVETLNVEQLLSCNPPLHVLIDDSNSFVAVLVPENSIMWTSHDNALPSVRGKQAVSMARAVVKWMFDNTPCKKIIGYTPVSNRPAVMFTRMIGMVKEGQLKNAIQINGVLSDIYVSGICKE